MSRLLDIYNTHIKQDLKSKLALKIYMKFKLKK